MRPLRPGGSGIIELPDTDDELAKTEFVPRESKDQALEPVTGYLPSKSFSPGVSTAAAQAICRRLVAVHCVYGVDKNPLAVELAKLALWLESHAEGMPLTFLDHRLVVGDSLTGPFWDKLLFRPGKPDTPIEDLFSQGIYGKLQKALTRGPQPGPSAGIVSRVGPRGRSGQGGSQGPARPGTSCRSVSPWRRGRAG